MFRKTNQTKRGFTLIELLVVIAIIGVLASVVLASLNSARTKARDSRRASDINQLKLALELYYDDENQYPPHDSGTRVASSLTELTAARHMPSLPLDPVAGDTANGYRYAHGAGYRGYTLLVQFETDTHTGWCGYSENGGFSNWVNASWYRDMSHADCQ